MFRLTLNRPRMPVSLQALKSVPHAARVQTVGCRELERCIEFADQHGELQPLGSVRARKVPQTQRVTENPDRRCYIYALYAMFVDQHWALAVRTDSWHQIHSSSRPHCIFCLRHVPTYVRDSSDFDQDST